MVGIGNKGTITLAIIKCIQEELTLNFIPYIYTTVLKKIWPLLLKLINNS